MQTYLLCDSLWVREQLKLNLFDDKAGYASRHGYLVIDKLLLYDQSVSIWFQKNKMATAEMFRLRLQHRTSPTKGAMTVEYIHVLYRVYDRNAVMAPNNRKQQALLITWKLYYIHKQ